MADFEQLPTTMREANDVQQEDGSSPPDTLDPKEGEDLATISSQLSHDPQESTNDEALGDDEAARISHLAATAKDQDEIEKDIGRQADQMLLDQAEERDQKRVERTVSQKDKLVSQIKRLEQRLKDPTATTASAAARIRAEIQHLQPQLESLDRDLEQIHARMEERRREGVEAEADGEQGGNIRRPGESRRDFLIRTGKITPFSRLGQTLQKTSSNLADVMLDAEEASDGGTEDDDEGEEEGEIRESAQPLSHRNLLMPGFADDEDTQTDSTADVVDDRPRKKRRVGRSSRASTDALDSQLVHTPESDDEFDPDAEGIASASDAESDDDQSSAEAKASATKRRKRGEVPKNGATIEDDDIGDDAVENLEGVDDGNERVYLERVQQWTRRRKAARKRVKSKTSGADADIKADDGLEDNSDQQLSPDAEDEHEWLMPHPSRADAIFQNDFRIPGDIYPSLFDYQKTGVQWLWELYSQQVGGIVGDEMGLGKTIQVIAFLAGLHHSNKLRRPVIIVTPATVMKQWVNEFHRWWPPLRVSILHTSGSGMMDVRSERLLEDSLESGMFDGQGIRPGRGSKVARKVVNRVLKDGHVLVTTYSGLQSYADILLPIDWGYAVLDEGHKIRNPNAKITIFCKSLRTPNRIILSGTPMQNNLTELWSLFDFIFPLRLGNLVSFRSQFEIPIKQGGYANASNLQVETALQCAEALKDTISPYLLQRFKIDVAADLPRKSEQVLFCRLTKLQRDAYEAFLSSSEMTSILEGKRQALYGIDILRKICNHPDLQDHRRLSIKPGYDYGVGSKSGKMQVVKALLQLWRDTGHKTLLFAQHRIMLDILERFLNAQGGFRLRRMDGTTPIKDRQSMVDEFNRDPNLHVFLLTTKVGGLGVNLTGADRVIIYDPDWNPSTDMQARERSWRLGQKREVMIYRLMTAGTIEEKIYHRQIFKQFLTNKILRDPKQRQTFQLKDLHDLFSLGNANDEATETGGLFKGTEVKFSGPAATSSSSENQDLPTPPEEAVRAPADSAAINAIKGISHREDFDTGEEATIPNVKPRLAAPGTDGSGTSTPLAANNDSRLLSTIFSRSGVHSALEHDAIISGSSRGKVTADPVIISREAKRVAALAAKELQRAGESARSVPAGTPTWTGLYGSAGRPDEARYSSRGRGGMTGGRGGRGGPSSAAVLAGLSARQHGQPESGGSMPGEEQPRGKDFIALIRDYLVAHGGAVHTQMLIDHFNRYCRTPERTVEFKEMLRAIAVLEKGPEATRGRGRFTARPRDRSRGGRAKWVLRREFGGTA